MILYIFLPVLNRSLYLIVPYPSYLTPYRSLSFLIPRTPLPHLVLRQSFDAVSGRC